MLDFSDLEHLAVRCPPVGEDGPTELAEQLSRRYSEIMVDEYQETSRCKRHFRPLLSGENLFLVGDVKQSIYRFRLSGRPHDLPGKVPDLPLL